ncbi:MAG: hypothetical protein NZ899_09805 [Thermoguttaceae bacterium]|nr:hypothetical protein [Thermoguttaceae bacterium]MDW8077576.1 hypothetical protein [Thermoguttaceae bacterium]
MWSSVFWAACGPRLPGTFAVALGVVLLMVMPRAELYGQGFQWRAAGENSAQSQDSAERQIPALGRQELISPGATSAASPNASVAVGTQGGNRSSVGTWTSATGTSTASTGEASRSQSQPVTLPANAGQIWREYDIRVYTSQIQTTKRPEVAVLDWILRETGYEVWHGEVPALLSVGREKVQVFHTPEIQDVVADVIRRFTANGAEIINMSVRLIVVSNPGWQASWLHALTPVKVHSPGIKAWVLYREDASLLLADLRRRPDYREHHAPQLAIPNGQMTVVSATKARPYTKYLAWRPETWPGFSPETSFVDEGFTLEISPLLSVDRQQIDVVLRLEVTQIERLVPLVLEFAGGPGQPSRPRLEVPQRAQATFHERFRWVVEQALLVDLGMAPVPLPVESSLFSSWIFPLSASSPRGNVLILVEVKTASASAAQAASTTLPSTGGRRNY